MKIAKLPILYGIIALLILTSIYFYANSNLQKKNIDKLNRYVEDLRLISGVGVIGDVHYHADIAIYINDKKIDLGQDKYQLMARHVHLENGEGEVIHIHVSGLTLSHFLNSLGLKLTDSCLKTNSEDFCNDEKSKIKVYVNGKVLNAPQSYVIKDLDKILISYGSEDEIQIEKQINPLTNHAIKYSKK